MRAWHLAARGLWLDEAFSALYAELPLDTLVELRHRGTNPPLYHLVLGWWTGAFGGDERGLRSLSVAAGVAGVALMYPLGHRVGGRRVGLVACGLMAVSNWAVAYSREARYYALLETLAIATTLLLFDALKERGARRFAGFAAATAASLWVHTYAWFVLAAQVIYVVCRVRTMPSDARRARLFRGFSISVGAAVAAFVPWLPVLADQIREVSEAYWIPPPRWIDVGEWAQGMIAPCGGAKSVIVIGCGVTIMWTAVVRLRGRSRRRGPVPAVDRVDMLYLALWLVIPLAVPLCWSLVGTPIFLPKYAIVSQPAAVLLLALAAVRRPGLCAGLYAALTVALPERAYAPLIREDWRAAARTVEDHASPDARVFIYRDYCYYALRYYLDPVRPITPVYHPVQRPSEFEALYPDGGVPFRHLLDAARGEEEVWIVLARVGTRGDDELDALVGRLCARPRPCARYALKEVDVLHLPSVVAPEHEVGHGGQ